MTHVLNERCASRGALPRSALTAYPFPSLTLGEEHSPDPGIWRPLMVQCVKTKGALWRAGGGGRGRSKLSGLPALLLPAPSAQEPSTPPGVQEGLSSPASCTRPGSATGLVPGRTRSFALSDTCSLRCSSRDKHKPYSSLERRKREACAKRENRRIPLEERAELVRESALAERFNGRVETPAARPP